MSNFTFNLIYFITPPVHNVVLEHDFLFVYTEFTLIEVISKIYTRLYVIAANENQQIYRQIDWDIDKMWTLQLYRHDVVTNVITNSHTVSSKNSACDCMPFTLCISVHVITRSLSHRVDHRHFLVIICRDRSTKLICTSCSSCIIGLWTYNKMARVDMLQFLQGIFSRSTQKCQLHGTIDLLLRSILHLFLSARLFLVVPTFNR